MTDNQDLVLIEGALAEFDKVSAGLAQLSKNFAGVLYDVERPEGMNSAKAARKLLREKRTSVERVRTEAKAPLLAIGRRLDTEAKRITVELSALEDPIALQITTEEGRAEREAADKIAAEEARIAALRARIAAIQAMSVCPSIADSAFLAARKAEIDALVIDASYQELEPEARTVKGQASAIVFGYFCQVESAEKERSRAAAEREEFEKLRAAQAERDRLAQVERDAENARIAEENRIERERLAAERAEQEKAAQAERERIAADAAKAKAEHDRIEAEARKAREAEEARIAGERRKLADEQEAARRHAERERTAAQNAEREIIINFVADKWTLSQPSALAKCKELFS